MPARCVALDKNRLTPAAVPPTDNIDHIWSGAEGPAATFGCPTYASCRTVHADRPIYGLGPRDSAAGCGCASSREPKQVAGAGSSATRSVPRRYPVNTDHTVTRGSVAFRVLQAANDKHRGHWHYPCRVIGRTDSAGGGRDLLPIVDKLLVLDDSTVPPGHGNSTTISRALQSVP